MLRVTQDLSYLKGGLKSGHKELEIEAEKWDEMTSEEHREYFDNYASVIIDDYSIEYCGADEREPLMIEEL